MPRYFAAATILASILVSANAGPLQVRMEKDSNTNFLVGPEARTTFELIEEYHPLSTAFNQQNRPRAMSSSLSKGPARRVAPSPAQILVDFGAPSEGDNASQRQGRYQNDRLRTLNSVPSSSSANIGSNRTVPAKSHWLEWTRWSACANGERIRIRQCLEVDNVRCEGESVQRQACFGPHSQVPVAKDPLVIEREILGVDAPIVLRRA